MGRPKERTDMLMPIYKLTVRRWGFSGRAIQRLCGLAAMPESDFARVLRSDDATPEEVATVGTAIFQYGKKHNLQGWEKLEKS